MLKGKKNRNSSNKGIQRNNTVRRNQKGERKKENTDKGVKK
jgi:hypothetical protein